MASSKRLTFLLFALALVASSVNASDLLSGTRSYSEKLECYGNVHLAAVPGQVVYKTLRCQVAGSNNYINYVSARDTSPYGRGGYASVQAGGLNQRYVDVYVWSQLGQPLDFDVNVYSKP